MLLLAHDDVSYEWVGSADWRVSEVRLLREVGSFYVGHAPADDEPDCTCLGRSDRQPC
jgi:hypothetical protein